MRICVVTPFVPYPLHSGGAVAQFCLIDRLRKRHEIHYAFPLRRAADRRSLDDLRRLWPDVTFHPWPVDRPPGAGTWQDVRWRLLQRFRNPIRARFEPIERQIARRRFFHLIRDQKDVHLSLPGWANHIRRWTDDVSSDLIQVEFAENLPLIQSLPHNRRAIFGHHELMWVRRERELRALGRAEPEITTDVQKTLAEETTALRAYDGVFTLSEEDSRKLAIEIPDTPVWASFPALPALPPVAPAGAGSITRLAFLGGEEHFPNYDAVTWFLTEIWPRLAQRHPVIEFVVAGKWSLEARMALGRIPGVRFLGYVPDLTAALRGTLLVTPIRIGSGVRIKLLQGAAMGLPLVSTTIGAEGLPLVPGRDWWQADTPDEWIAAIDHLLSNPTLTAQLARSAQHTVSTACVAEQSVARREAIYAEVMARPVGRRRS